MTAAEPMAKWCLSDADWLHAAEQMAELADDWHMQTGLHLPERIGILLPWPLMVLSMPSLTIYLKKAVNGFFFVQ